MTDHTDHYVLGSIIGAQNITGRWGEFREELPHPAVFNNGSNNMLAMSLEYAWELEYHLEPKTLAGFLDAIPFWRMRQKVSLLEKYLNQGDTVRLDRAMLRGVIGGWADLKQGADDCDENTSVLEHVGGLAVIADLMGKGLPSRNVQELADTILGEYNKRECREHLRKVIRESELPEFDPGQKVRDLSLLFHRYSRTRHSQTDFGDGVLEWLESEDPAMSRSMKFDITLLDEALEIVPGSLLVVAAPPGCGKTGLVWQSAVETAQWQGDDSVMYWSFELSKAEHIQRMVARLTGKTLKEVSDKDFTNDEIERIKAKYASVRGCLYLHDNTTPPCTVEEIENHIKRHKSEHPNLKVIYIDYLQRMSYSLPRSARDDLQLGHITKGLKAIAGMHQIAVVLVSQENRDGRKEIRSRGGDIVAVPEPRLGDLKGSGAIEDDATHVLFLWPQVDPDEDDSAVLPLKYVIAKNRNGPVNKVSGSFIRSCQRLR